MESWVGLGGKEGRTNIQISAELGIEPGTLWSKGRDLTNCADHALQIVPKAYDYSEGQIRGVEGRLKQIGFTSLCS